MEQPSLLSHLIVTEMIRELSKKYENFHNKREIVEQNIYLFGKKPGFAMTSQLIRKNNSDKRGIHEVAEFMAKTLTPAIFGIPSITAGFKINENRLSIGFQHKIPKPFSFFTNFQVDEKEAFYYYCYCWFFCGVYEGSLLHFGYKSVPRIEKAENEKLIFVFEFK